jgi:hypothetical protein
MENPQEKALELLNDLNIEYQIIHHPAAFTVEDMDKLNWAQYGDGCVNLFLRDANVTAGLWCPKLDGVSWRETDGISGQLFNSLAL